MRHMRKEILPGVFLSCVEYEGDRMSLRTLSLYLLTHLDREHAAQNAAIPGVLRRGNDLCSDKEELQGGYFSVDQSLLAPEVFKMGEIQGLGFSLVIGDHEDIEKSAGFLGELLLSPNTRGGLLQPQHVESEKQALLEKVREVHDDPVVRLIEQMCPGEDYAVCELGDEQTVEVIHYVSLTKHYKHLLAVSPIEISYRGGEDFDQVADALRDALVTLPRGELDMDIGTDIRLNTVDDHIRVFGDEPEGKGILAVGYRLGEAMEDMDIPALMVTCQMVDEDEDTLLRDSLRMDAPYIDFIKGVMTNYCEIQGEKYPEAVEKLQRRLQTVKAGQITAEELKHYKEYVTIGMEEDAYSGAMADFWWRQKLLGLEYGPKEFVALVEDVTVEDVVKAAAGIEIDAVYYAMNSSEED